MTEVAQAQQPSRHVRLLLASYPPEWRRRYDDEMRDTVIAMQAAGRWRLSSSRDLFRGLVEAWLDPTTTPEETPMNDSTTHLIPRAAWGLLLFVLAGMGFAKVIEDPIFSAAADHHPVLAWTVDLLTVTAIATAIVMAVAALPSLVALLRAKPRPDRHTYVMLATIPVGIAVILLSIFVAKDIADGNGTHSVRTILAFGFLVAVTLAVGTVMTAALVRLATRVPDSPMIERSRLIAMIAVGALTAVAALSVVTWLVAAALVAPHILSTDNGVLATSTLASVVLIAVVIVCGAALCATSGVSALADRRTDHGPHPAAGGGH